MPLRMSLSALLQDKYPSCDFSREVTRLQGVNSSLVGPYMHLLGLLAHLHQRHLEGQGLHGDNAFEINFLIEYAYLVSRMEFRDAFQP